MFLAKIKMITNTCKGILLIFLLYFKYSTLKSNKSYFTCLFFSALKRSLDWSLHFKSRINNNIEILITFLQLLNIGDFQRLLQINRRAYHELITNQNFKDMLCLWFCEYVITYCSLTFLPLAHFVMYKCFKSYHSHVYSVPSLRVLNFINYC